MTARAARTSQEPPTAEEADAAVLRFVEALAHAAAATDYKAAQHAADEAHNARDPRRA
jgi:hypothetical protein